MTAVETMALIPILYDPVRRLRLRVAYGETRDNQLEFSAYMELLRRARIKWSIGMPPPPGLKDACAMIASKKNVLAISQSNSDRERAFANNRNISDDHWVGTDLGLTIAKRFKAELLTKESAIEACTLGAIVEGSPSLVSSIEATGSLYIQLGLLLENPVALPLNSFMYAYDYETGVLLARDQPGREDYHSICEAQESNLLFNRPDGEGGGGGGAIGGTDIVDDDEETEHEEEEEELEEELRELDEDDD